MLCFDMIKITKFLITLLILLTIALIVSIVITGGFQVRIFQAEISIHSLTNPVSALFILILCRLFLAVGMMNSILLAGSLFIAALASEAALRILDPPISLPALKNMTQPSDLLGYRLVPGLRDGGIRINTHGLRDRERSREKPKGVKRLLGLGDSFTFGYQVRLEECYLKQLERILNGEGGTWDVINAGVTGYNMWQHVAYFTHYGYKYRPDLVTVGIYFDDFFGDDSPRKDGTKHRTYRSFSFLRLVNFGRNCAHLISYKYRYLFEAPWLKSLKDRRDYIRQSGYASLLAGEADPELYDTFRSRLCELTRSAGKEGARVLVVYIPDIVQLDYPALQEINHILADICAACNVDYLDMTPRFESVPDPKLLYLLPHDAHTSPEGHRLIAAEMEKKIRETFRNF